MLTPYTFPAEQSLSAQKVQRAKDLFYKILPKKPWQCLLCVVISPF